MKTPTPLLAKPASPGRRCTLYTALIAGGMMLLVYGLLGIWPFGDGSIVTGDLGGLYLNYFGHLRRFMLGEAGFAYGFDKGLGGNLLGLFATYYASPFNTLYALFPVRWFPVCASILLFAKIVLSCVLFHVYIAHKFPELHWRGVPLALCYGFMAYGIAYAQNIMWHDVMLLLPLICLGIDRICEGRPFLMYTAVLALAIYSNFYTAFMACIFAAIYFAYTMLLRGSAAKTIGTKGPLLRFAGGSVLAGGLCAALLLPVLYNLNQSKGGLLEYKFSFKALFPLQRLPERFVWGSFAATDMEGRLPFVYCGMLVLVLVFTFFASRSISKREKLLSGAVLLVLTLSFWIGGLDEIWHGLKEPVWFPARYSFVYCFFLVLLAARALAARTTGTVDVLFSGGVLFLALLLVTVFPIAVSRSRSLLSAFAVIFYAFALLFADAASSPGRRRLALGVMVFVTALELAMNAYYISNGFDRYSLSSHVQRVDTAGAVVKAIESADAGNYRIAETHYHSLNDSMLLGFRGISHFSSTQDGYAQSVLYNLGLRNYEGAGPYLSGGTAFADSVLGLAYLSDSETLGVPAHWQLGDIAAPYAVRQNPYVLPMLFSFDPAAMTPGRGEAYVADLFAYQNSMYRELGGAGTLLEDVESVELHSPSRGLLELDGDIPADAVYTLTASEAGYHYAYLQGPVQLLTLVINGEARDIYFAPYHQGAIDLGYLKPGDVVTLGFETNKSYEVSMARFVCLNDELLEAYARAAWENAGDFVVEDGRVTGSIEAGQGRNMLYTAIPYDADWRASVNGHSVQPQRFMGGLLAVPLEDGPNELVLRFVPSGVRAGIAVSALSALLYAAAVWLARAKRRERPQKGGR